MKHALLTLGAVLCLCRPCLADELIRGRYCHTLAPGEGLEEARMLTRTLAVRNAVESSEGFIRATAGLSVSRLTNEMLKVVSSACLKDLEVVDHREQDDRVCETIQAVLSHEGLERVIQEASRARDLRLEGEGLDNNGFLKILSVVREDDRYGERVMVVAKVLRRTGSLYTPEVRNRKPQFRICIDFLGANGIPMGGDAKFIHESDVEMVPGEMRAVHFYPPAAGTAYRVWLTQTGTGKTGKKTPPPPTAPKPPGGTPSAPPLQVSSMAQDRPHRLREIRPVLSGGLFRAELLIDGPVGDYRAFFEHAPPRLVIDLAGAWENPRQPTVEVEENEMVRRIRVGNHPDKLRVVLDLKIDRSLSEHRVEQSAQGLLVTVGRKNPPSN